MTRNKSLMDEAPAGIMEDADNSDESSAGIMEDADNSDEALNDIGADANNSDEVVEIIDEGGIDFVPDDTNSDEVVSKTRTGWLRRIPSTAWMGFIIAVGLLVLGLLLRAKLTTTEYTFDITTDGLKIVLVYVASEMTLLSIVLSGITLLFNIIYLKIQTKFVSFYNYIALAIGFIALFLYLAV